MSLPEEIRKKDLRVLNFIENNKIDGLLLGKRDNFAWISGGISGVEKCVQNGVVDVLFINGKKYLIASTIEKFRFFEEEVAGKGFELLDYEWYEGKDDLILSLTKGKKIASDTGDFNTLDMYKEIQRNRYVLEEEEIFRLRELSRLCANTVDGVCREIKQGNTEWDIAANLNYKLMKYGVEVPVCLIASDERIKKFRHPVPTGKKVEKHAMVVLGAEKHGLVVSITRMVHFGKPDEELMKRHRACLTVDAVFINNTVSGAKVSGIFKKGVEAYKKSGYPEEWKLHHQGGAAGYRSRDYIANFACVDEVQINQMFSWNPSISGTKSEDTILVTTEGPEVLTGIKDWPMLDISVGGEVLKRPDILIK